MSPRIYYDNSKYYKEKAKLPNPDGKHCIICGSKLQKGRRKYCSEKCSNWWIEFGVLDWKVIREKVLKRDNYTCQDCGKKDNLEVHHIKPIKDGGEEFDEDNCVTLCGGKNGCHSKRHKLLRTKSIELSKFT